MKFVRITMFFSYIELSEKILLDNIIHIKSFKFSCLKHDYKYLFYEEVSIEISLEDI